MAPRQHPFETQLHRQHVAASAASTALRVNPRASPSSKVAAASVPLFREPRRRPAGLPDCPGRKSRLRPRAGGGTISSLIVSLSPRRVFRFRIYGIWHCVNSNRTPSALITQARSADIALGAERVVDDDGDEIGHVERVTPHQSFMAELGSTTCAPSRTARPRCFATGGWRSTSYRPARRGASLRGREEKNTGAKLGHPRAADRDGEMSRDRPVSFAPKPTVRWARRYRQHASHCGHSAPPAQTLWASTNSDLPAV
jgi:hypothetical protein